MRLHTQALCPTHQRYCGATRPPSLSFPHPRAQQVRILPEAIPDESDMNDDCGSGAPKTAPAAVEPAAALKELVLRVGRVVLPDEEQQRLGMQ